MIHEPIWHDVKKIETRVTGQVEIQILFFNSLSFSFLIYVTDTNLYSTELFLTITCKIH